MIIWTPQKHYNAAEQQNKVNQWNNEVNNIRHRKEHTKKIRCQYIAKYRTQMLNKLTNLEANATIKYAWCFNRTSFVVIPSYSIELSWYNAFQKTSYPINVSFCFFLKLFSKGTNTMNSPVLWEFQELFNDVSFVYWESVIS